MSVMPETGLEPTMAMALAATVVKRKAMTVVRRMLTTANQTLCITPSQKKTNVTSRATPEASPMNLNDRSSPPPAPPEGMGDWLPLPTELSGFPSPREGLGVGFTSFTALLMTPHERTMPMMPAMAMPPMPMERA